MSQHLLLITFSLRTPFKDYASFFVALRGNALQWVHFIEQTCVVRCSYDVAAYTNILRPHIDATDSLLVVEVSAAQMQGWLPQYAWDWLNSVSDEVKQEHAAVGHFFDKLVEPPKRGHFPEPKVENPTQKKLIPPWFEPPKK